MDCEEGPLEGSLAGRSGSFVVHHGGTRSGGAETRFGYVVPGSGSDGLREYNRPGHLSPGRARRYIATRLRPRSLTEIARALDSLGATIACL